MGVGDMEDRSTLPPDEAFATVGNQTRIGILQTLGEGDGPLAFSELFERVEYESASNFSYHLDKLTDHFVHKDDGGYSLTRAGERVVESILSGAVTESPVVERTGVDQACHLCGAPTEVEYGQERLERYCSECPGMWSSRERGFLGALSLPPVGVQERSPDEAVRAAWIWQNLTIFALANDVCPRCSAQMENDVSVCESHDASEDICGRCDCRYAATLQFRCANCPFEMRGTFATYLSTHTDLLAFMTGHGLNAASTDEIDTVQRVYSDYDEEILSVDPFRARFTFSVDDEELTLTVDEDLEVMDVTK